METENELNMSSAPHKSRTAASAPGSREVSGRKCSVYVPAHNDQAGEHDENQEDIRHNRNDHGNFNALGIWHHAHAALRHPSRVKLRKDKSDALNIIEIV
jgi:hypothetical protein